MGENSGDTRRMSAIQRTTCEHAKQEPTPQRTLLIVDDDDDVRRMLRRALKRHFDEILVTSTLTQAEELLGQPHFTHFIGDKQVFEEISHSHPEWRRAHPALRCAVMFTGFEANQMSLEADVDAVVVKTSPLSELIDVLGVSRKG